MSVSPETAQVLWKTYETLCHSVLSQQNYVERQREGYEKELAELSRKQAERDRILRDLTRLGITGPPCETT